MTSRPHSKLFQRPARPPLRQPENCRGLWAQLARPVRFPENLIKGQALLMLLAMLFCGSFTAAGWAKEIMSNGRGGGPWSAPDAWRGNAPPGPADLVIITTNDTILFDGNYPGQAACRQLLIGAGGRLNFKEEAAQHILSVAGPIEVQGHLRLNLSRFPQGLAEIRLIAAKEEERIIQLTTSNATFMAHGAPGLPDGRCNVIVSTGPPRPGLLRRTALIQGAPDGNNQIDFKNIGMAHMGDCHSNGRGGGNWSDPNTWHAKIVPTGADIVVIAADDTVVFDGNYPGQAACRQLLIDAGGRLNFKEETAQHILSVAGPIEVYGYLRLNLSRFPEGLAEIRLLADKEEERVVHVARNAVFDIIGASGFPDGHCNVIVSTGPPRPGLPRRAALVKGYPGAQIDLKNVGMAHRGEYHSNGRGGGNWNDPETWHDRIIPAGADIVVIAANDTVVFDGHSPVEPSCRKILIDPKGILTFKTDTQPHALSVAGPIECYGTIRMDGSKAPLGAMELRLVAEADAERTIRMLPNSALLLNGAEQEGGRKNIVLSTSDPRREALIVVQDETMIDLHRSELRSIVLQVADLDNTGFKPNERLNIVENDFTGQARLALAGCDTPVVQNNTFVYAAEKPLGFPAILVNACKLVQIRQNTFTGRYADAIQAQQDLDSSVSENSISNAMRGICWSGQNAMLRGNAIFGCATGIFMDNASAVVERATVRRSELALDLRRSQVQLTDVRVEDIPTNGLALTLDSTAATLLNCNLDLPRIKVSGTAPANGPFVQTMNYLVVQVKGRLPPQTMVELRTAAVSGGPPKGGAADLNVRNSPTRINAEGFTPLPRSLRALVVRSWALGRDGKKADAPFYDLVVSAPGEKGSALKTLKSLVIEPKNTWYRPDPNQLTATVEVALP